MFSKSDYTRGLQCPKMLWMRKHMPDSTDETVCNSAVIEQGHEVGELAKGYFGPYIEVENDFDFVAMAKRTRALIAAAQAEAATAARPKTICEATFITDDNLLCMADLITVNSDGSLSMIEVKSSTKVKPHHLDDAAFQAHVIEECGFTVSNVSIMHVDSGYVRNGELNLESFMKLEDVSDEVDGRIAGIAEGISSLRKAEISETEPDTAIGKHCNSPHSCPFQGWCWRNMPEKSVFDLAGVGRTRGWAWWEKGIRTYEQAAAAMKPNGLREAQAGQSSLARPELLRDFLATLSWPLYHLDFETFQTAVPKWDGCKPYQQITSQFSLHVQREPGAAPEHFEFLAEEGKELEVLRCRGAGRGHTCRRLRACVQHVIRAREDQGACRGVSRPVGPSDGHQGRDARPHGAVPKGMALQARDGVVVLHQGGAAGLLPRRPGA